MLAKITDYMESVPEEIHEALIRCDTGSKVVPKTLLCLNCAAPILYKNPSSAKEVRTGSK